MAMVSSEERGSAAESPGSPEWYLRRQPDDLDLSDAERVADTSLFIGGGLQLANDVAFYLMFRNVRPPEEMKESAAQRSSA